MNSLNSILLEGTLISDPVETNSGKVKSCSFQIANDRYIKKKDDAKKYKTSNFEIEAHEKIAEICLKNLKKDRGCRVVGRLETKEIVIHRDNIRETVEYEKVIIVADHVEIKPGK